MIDGYPLRSEPVVGERMETSGVDWGPKGIIMLYREGDWASYKIPGHMAWTGNFSPWRWYAGRYGIVNIEEFAPAESNSYWGRIKLIHRLEIKPGHYYRAAAKKLKSDVRRLANETITIGELVNERQE